ncbi:hypothetical protein ADICEAN_02220 [Cesiribacter andamanensis AMV16]|uniref:Uncharacterized protein n=1 Tax=Cesiribacter andamanensis AMV16 TaxID=1279009 RepID=M7N5V5_9BACT|nr:hypothetical protein ADICEAN_02220 [Cesiribacter andamanensis AMV16]
MIVNASKGGWEVIFQRAHELLAMQLGWHWRPEQRPHFWLETLAAIGDHDNEQDAWHGRDHLTKAGAPLISARRSFRCSRPQAL